jgi:hypothetical protein
MIRNFVKWGSRSAPSASGTCVGVNPALVASVEQLGHAPPCCRIIMSNGSTFEVEGAYVEVTENLSGEED